MNSLSQLSHLTEEQFSGLLLERSEVRDDAAARAHLAACADCRAELERVRDSLASFNAMGMEWAERRSATLGPVRIAPVAGRRMPLVWATAMLLVAGAIFAGVQMRQQGQETLVAANHPAAVVDAGVAAPAVSTAAPAVQEQTQPVRMVKAAARAAVRGADTRIEDDNRLLQAIDQELSSGESLLVPVSELRTGGGKTPRRLTD